uniref:Secreted protein n=1 Tax=Trichogramma kaykai TaxID=54128 RepID=A0ABD2W908_9HYME
MCWSAVQCAHAVAASRPFDVRTRSPLSSTGRASALHANKLTVGPLGSNTSARHSPCRICTFVHTQAYECYNAREKICRSLAWRKGRTRGRQRRVRAAAQCVAPLRRRPVALVM